MNLWKLNKKVLFAVSGGIAAYKAPDIIHGLVKAGCEVETIMTESAEEFVSPLVISTMTKKRVWRERDFLSAEEGWKIPHITLTDWADCFAVAPCTANVLSICASGGSSTLLGAAMLAYDKPIIFFPAMNGKMLANPATVRNINSVKEMGHIVVEPDRGMLACGYEGKGRLPANNVIHEHIYRALCPLKDLSGLKVTVTAGPTHEYIDPVRYISNPSSGRMGYAIAKAAWYRGADVTLISGPCSITPPVGVEIINVVSADEMYRECINHAPSSDIIINAAAVGDFKAADISDQKIKRKDGEPMVLNLVQNHDIAAELGKIKREGQILVGFAAETQNLKENAQKKMQSKNLDIIAANNVLAKDAGFGTDTNTLAIMVRGSETTEVSGTKDEAANALLDTVLRKKSGE